MPIQHSQAPARPHAYAYACVPRAVPHRSPRVRRWAPLPLSCTMMLSAPPRVTLHILSRPALAPFTLPRLSLMNICAAMTSSSCISFHRWIIVRLGRRWLYREGRRPQIPMAILPKLRERSGGAWCMAEAPSTEPQAYLVASPKARRTGRGTLRTSRASGCLAGGIEEPWLAFTPSAFKPIVIVFQLPTPYPYPIPPGSRIQHERAGPTIRIYVCVICLRSRRMAMDGCLRAASLCLLSLRPRHMTIQHGKERKGKARQGQAGRSGERRKGMDRQGGVGRGTISSRSGQTGCCSCSYSISINAPVLWQRISGMKAGHREAVTFMLSCMVCSNL